MDRNRHTGHSRTGQSGLGPTLRTRRELEFYLNYTKPRPTHARYQRTRLDWWVNAAAILIVLVLAALLAYEFHGKTVAEMEWLSIAARMLAYDKPL
jgi:hypothetical protein